MSKELNSLDLEVKQMMLGWPSIFPSRLECLHHLFCVNGNGYKWHKDPGEGLKLIGIESTNFTKIKLEEVPTQLTLRSDFVRITRTNMIREFTEKHIDYLCQDYGHLGSQMNALNIYHLDKNYSPMMKVIDCLDDVDENWRKGMKEMCGWITDRTHEAYDIMRGHPDISHGFCLAKIRANPIPFYTYKLALKLSLALGVKYSRRFTEFVINELEEEESCQPTT